MSITPESPDQAARGKVRTWVTSQWKLSRSRVSSQWKSTATHLIFPEHLKYDQTQKAPYSALLERLRTFLSIEDTLLISIGFSYADAHITDRISEALDANPAASVFAFQFQNLDKETYAAKLASRRPNFSVYARDKAVVSGVAANWQAPNELPTKDWGPIRNSYWSMPTGGPDGGFKLGAIEDFTRFFANSRSPQAFDASVAPTPPAPTA